MTRILCCSCNKTIKTTGKQLKVCKECGRPVCWACQLEGICKDCGLILHQNTILKEYYDDKNNNIALSCRGVIRNEL